MTLNDHFNLFESLARRLVEGAFDRPSTLRRLVHEAARQIAMDIERTSVTNKQANAYSIGFHPDSLDTLMQRSPNLHHFLDDYLHDIALEYDLTPPDRPGIQLIANQVLAPDQVQIRAIQNNVKRQATVQAPALTSGSDRDGVGDSRAFLIQNGRKHIALVQPLITLGRHLDCDIILDDPSTSRQHAQLRWRAGHFIILDLGSKAGTLVNNKPISRHVLQNGDVIRLGNVALVYGEEADAHEHESGSRDIDDGKTRQLPRTGLQ